MNFERFALSAAELSIARAHSLCEDPCAFNTAESIEVEGRLCPQQLEAAVNRVHGCYEVLNSLFILTPMHEERLVPNELDWVSVRFAELEGGDDPEEAMRQWALQNELHRPFELGKAPSCRWWHLRCGGRDYIYLAAHHIALDGHAYGLVWRRLCEEYEALGEGGHQRVAVKKPAITTNRLQQSDACDAAQAYWQRWWDGYSGYTAFQSRSLVTKLSFGYHQQEWALSEQNWQRLKQLSREQGFQWLDGFAALLAIALRVFTGSDEAVFLRTVAQRPPQLVAEPCMSMNLVPWGCLLEAGDTLQSLGVKFHQHRSQSRAFQGWSGAMKKPGAHSGAPWSAVINVLPFEQSLSLLGHEVVPKSVCAGPVADLAVQIYFDGRRPPVWRLQMPRAEAEAAYLGRLIQVLNHSLEAWLSEPKVPIESLIQELLGEMRQRELVGRLSPPTEFLGLMELFKRQVLEKPDAPAFAGAGGELSYIALYEKIQAWGLVWRNQGLGPGERVAVIADDPRAGVTAMLALWQLGCCYIPLDPQLEGEERDRLLEAAQAGGWLRANAHDCAPDFISRPGRLGHQSCARSGSRSACVMFTSGSSGQPKAVEIGFDDLAVFWEAAHEAYGSGSGERICQFASLVFDASIEEVLMALLSGSALVFLSPALLRDPQSFGQQCREHSVSLVDLPTAFWHEWVANLWATGDELPSCIKTVILGGEAVLPVGLAQWFKVPGAAGVKLINSYGPTETTIVATTCRLTRHHLGNDHLPIGQPLSSLATLVLGTGGAPASRGELVLVFRQLSNRYLGRSKPLASRLRIGKQDYSAYFTGDLVRRQEGGEIEFLGRIDDQVKVAGHRLNLLDMEAAIAELIGVSHAAALQVEFQGRRVLIALVAGAPGWDTVRLRQLLGAEFPAACLPTALVCLSQFRLTATGKLDRHWLNQQALAYLQNRTESEKVGTELEGAEKKARTESLVRRLWRRKKARTESLVRRLWRRGLGLGSDQVSSDSVLKIPEDFQLVGGTSMQAIEIATELTGALGRQVTVADVLERPRLDDLCEFLCSQLDMPEPDLLGNHGWERLGSGSEGSLVVIFPGWHGGPSQFESLAEVWEGAVEVWVVSLDFKSLTNSWDSFTKRLFRAVGPRPMSLMGHSWGGFFATKAAGQFKRAKGARHSRSELGWDLCLLDSYFTLDGAFSDPEAKKQLAALRGFLGQVPLVGSELRILQVFAEDSRVDMQLRREAHFRDREIFFSEQCLTRCQAPGGHLSMLEKANVNQLAGLLLPNLNSEVGQ